MKGDRLNQLITIPEMAILLHISRPAAYKLIREPEFPIIKISERRFRVDEIKLMDWLSKKTIQN